MSREDQIEQLRRESHFGGFPLDDDRCAELVSQWIQAGLLSETGSILGVFSGTCLSAMANPRTAVWYLTDTHVITVESSFAGLRFAWKAYPMSVTTVSRTNYIVIIRAKRQHPRSITLGQSSGLAFNETVDAVAMARATQLEAAIRDAQWALRQSAAPDPAPKPRSDRPHALPADVERLTSGSVGWHPDPWGRFESRYMVSAGRDMKRRGNPPMWRWTAKVVTGGIGSLDQPGAHPVRLEQPIVSYFVRGLAGASKKLLDDAIATGAAGVPGRFEITDDERWGLSPAAGHVTFNEIDLDALYRVSVLPDKPHMIVSIHPGDDPTFSVEIHLGPNLLVDLPGYGILSPGKPVERSSSAFVAELATELAGFMRGIIDGTYRMPDAT